MFNKHKIQTLESAVKFLEHERNHHRDKIWRLESHIELLAKHMGLEIKELPPHTIVVKRAP